MFDPVQVGNDVRVLNQLQGSTGGGQRAHGRFGGAGESEFPDNNNVQRGRPRPRHFGGDGDPAARQTQDQLVGVILQRSSSAART